MAKSVTFWRRCRYAIKPIFACMTLRCFGVFPLSFNRALGEVIGKAIYLSRSGVFCLSLSNIRKAFPELSDSQQFRLAKHSVIEMAKTALETATVWHRPYLILKRYTLGVANLNLLTKPRSRGLLLLAPHVGNWEFLGSFLAQHVDITIIYQPSGIKAMDNIIMAGRCREGVKLAPANRKGVAMVIQALREGKCVGILPDQVPERHSGRIATKFFNHPAWTMTLVTKLIQRTDCDAIMGYAKRVPRGFHINFEQVDENLFSANETTSAKALNNCVEKCVRSAPEQYQWEYRRYKRYRCCERDQEMDQQMTVL